MSNQSYILDTDLLILFILTKIRKRKKTLAVKDGFHSALPLMQVEKAKDLLENVYPCKSAAGPMTQLMSYVV